MQLNREIAFFSDHWPAYFIGLSITLCVVFLFHSLELVGVDLVSRTIILFAAVVAAAYLGGLRGGLTSAVIMIAYVFYYFSEPGALFTYTPENLGRVIAKVIAVPLVAVAVGSLRRKVDIHESMANAAK